MVPNRATHHNYGSALKTKHELLMSHFQKKLTGQFQENFRTEVWIEKRKDKWCLICRTLPAKDRGPK